MFGVAWDKDDASDADVLLQAAELVEEFLVLLRTENVANDILDADELPASKMTLINAFRLVIATEHRAEDRQRLARVGRQLSRFQENVGPRISLMPADRTAPKAARRADRETARRFDSVFEAVAQDARRLDLLFTLSARIAERRDPTPRMTPVFEADGTYSWFGHH
ncbi:hypothetical protein BJF93_22745 [Xaviernesmea oryzae]|uniref:Uncharacterized protein n=1 Tax=Xaviernesmea oryzae TaxID=464029 RepID=A0A1Q9ATV6_9HYPH|nr:hypothetical protein [Xaviernesmea oryzae]OLP58856.1 hypothetical protein BJF93_22745 [Xaviernesmea oryzae]SEM03736.1 hypothetical protein SAMN04487976_117119 [Xaviernesmea oryzae]